MVRPAVGMTEVVGAPEVVVQEDPVQVMPPPPVFPMVLQLLLTVPLASVQATTLPVEGLRTAPWGTFRVFATERMSYQERAAVVASQRRCPVKSIFMLLKVPV